MTNPVSAAQWNAGNATLSATIDGVALTGIPADPNNSDYRLVLAWVAAGNTIAAAPGPTVAQLEAYAETVWRACLAKGQTFNVAAAAAPAIPILCDGTNATRADLAMLALFGQANPTGTKEWTDNNKAVSTLTGTQLVALATLAGDWVSDTYPALNALNAEIAAGTVTTTAEIDAYAWPTS